MLKGKKCPRAGLRVKADPNPASMAMYSPGHGPTPGATGATTAVPLPGGRKTCFPGPGGGLVYVKWDDGRTFGVSRYDLSKAKDKVEPMRSGGLGHDPLHNEQVLKEYSKCLRKCKKKPAVGECIDKCLGYEHQQAVAGVGSGDTEHYAKELFAGRRADSASAHGEQEVLQGDCSEAFADLKVALYDSGQADAHAASGKERKNLAYSPQRVERFLKAFKDRCVR